MICFIALIVFGILGVFSAAHRKIAAEAFDCVFKRLTLRKCDTGLDMRLKSQITGTLHNKNPKLARHLFKRFEIYSWILLIVMLASLFYSAYGIYNYVVYGNCNGEDSDVFCIYDALSGEGEVSSVEEGGLCAAPVNVTKNELAPPDISLEAAYGNPNAELTLVEFGCYACTYTRKAQPEVQKILGNYDGRVNLIYLDFPITNHEKSEMLSQAVYCADLQGKRWEFHFDILGQEEAQDRAFVDGLAESYGLDTEKFSECMAQDPEERIKKDILKGELSGVYGTPTFFINSRSIVGPKPYNYFKNIINDELTD